MADDDKKVTPIKPTGVDTTKVNDDTAKDAGKAEGAKKGHFITGTGVTTLKDGTKVMTDQPDNLANDAEVGKPAKKDDDK